MPTASGNDLLIGHSRLCAKIAALTDHFKRAEERGWPAPTPGGVHSRQ